MVRSRPSIAAMIGLDTNVLVRIIVGDDEKQAEKAERVLKSRCTPETPGFVNSFVLCELAWTLDRTYGYSRAQIAGVMEKILENSGLRIENADLVAAALRLYRTAAASFSDALLAEINLAAGCESTFTFDRKAARLDGFTLVS
jgi:predicted nucleic-acid-binding protein